MPRLVPIDDYALEQGFVITAILLIFLCQKIIKK